MEKESGVAFPFFFVGPFSKGDPTTDISLPSSAIVCLSRLQRGFFYEKNSSANDILWIPLLEEFFILAIVIAKFDNEAIIDEIPGKSERLENLLRGMNDINMLKVDTQIYILFLVLGKINFSIKIYLD